MIFKRTNTNREAATLGGNQILRILGGRGGCILLFRYRVVKWSLKRETKFTRKRRGSEFGSDAKTTAPSVPNTFCRLHAWRRVPTHLTVGSNYEDQSRKSTDHYCMQINKIWGACHGVETECSVHKLGALWIIGILRQRSARKGSKRVEKERGTQGITDS